MSFSSTGILALFPGTSLVATDPTSALLGILSGGSAAGGAVGGSDPLQALQVAEKNQTQEVAQTAKQPEVARDIAAFRAAVAHAKTPADLLANPTALKVLLTANGLGDQVQFTALAQKALLSNPADSNALVNKLSDTRWKTTAQTYDFATKGLAVLQNPQVQDSIANAYAEITWRQSLDATTPGLSNALVFCAQAASITSADQILGDPVLRDVVTTALGIPLQIAFQDLGAQEKAITSRVNIADFQKPNFVTGFIDRYLLAKKQASAGQITPTLDSLAVQARGLVV
jgi:hypothetical protein